jgi:hypothetical protein
MLVARPYADPKRFEAAASQLLESLTGAAAREPTEAAGTGPG